MEKDDRKWEIVESEYLNSQDKSIGRFPIINSSSNVGFLLPYS